MIWSHPIRSAIVLVLVFLGMQKLLFWRKGSGTCTGIEEVKKGAEMEAASRMSTFYISHGSPMLPLEEGSTRDFLAEKLPSLVGPRCVGCNFILILAILLSNFLYVHLFGRLNVSVASLSDCSKLPRHWMKSLNPRT